MPFTKHSRSRSWSIVAVVIASTTMMNLTFISANRSSLVFGARSARALEHSRADASNPLSVTPSLDSTRAASATMAEDGGTLSVAAANGTTFTLTVPTDALVSEEEITMTPVTAIPDLPFSQGLGGGGAVQLGPEGLLLVKPATLTVQLASPISIDQQCSFAWYKAGEDFHLFPLTLDLTTVAIDVDHFNGYGIAGGSSDERDAVAAHSPSRSEARFTQQIAQDTGALRQTLSRSPTRKQAKKATKRYNNQIFGDFVSAFTDLDKQIGTDLGSGTSVAPRSRPNDVAPSPAALRCDLLNVLVQLINLRNHGLTIADLGSLGNPDLATHITNAFNDLVIDSLARCEQGNVREIGTLLGLARLAFIFAALDASLASLSTVAQNIENEAMNCVHLKLTFDSTITQVKAISPVLQVQIELEATDVQLTPRIDGREFFYNGSAPLIHHIDTITNGSQNPCSISDSSTNSTLKIISLEFRIHPRLVECPGEDATPPIDLDLFIDTGLPLENFSVTCPPPEPGFSTPGDTNIWRAQFYCEHQKSALGPESFHFMNWDTTGVVNNLATKLFQDVIPPECPAYSEFTVIRVNRAE